VSKRLRWLSDTKFLSNAWSQKDKEVRIVTSTKARVNINFVMSNYIFLVQLTPSVVSILVYLQKKLKL
jgi:hypothetical protein